jgi:hypothetical protein
LKVPNWFPSEEFGHISAPNFSRTKGDYRLHMATMRPLTHLIWAAFQLAGKTKVEMADRAKKKASLFILGNRRITVLHVYRATIAHHWQHLPAGTWHPQEGAPQRRFFDRCPVTRSLMATSGSPDIGFRSMMMSEGWKSPSGGRTALHFYTLCSY